MSLTPSRRHFLKVSAGALAVTPFALPFVARGAAKLTLNFGDHNAVGSVLANTAARFGTEVGKISNGAIDVKHYPAAQLGSQRELLDQVKLGTLQMCYGDPPYLSNLVPQYAVMDLPFVFNDWAHVERVMDGDVTKELGEALIASQGLRPLSWMHIGFRNMLTISKPVAVIGDFAGMKFRSPEVASFVEMFKALGATPVPVPWGEVYTAMRTGLVDGIETTPEGMVNSKLYEVGKFVTRTQHINTVGSPIVSERFWKGLAAEQQAMIQQAITSVTTWERAEMKTANDKSEDELKSKGLGIRDIDKAALQKAVEPVWAHLSAKAKGGAELVKKIRAAA